MKDKVRRKDKMLIDKKKFVKTIKEEFFKNEKNNELNQLICGL